MCHHENMEKLERLFFRLTGSKFVMNKNSNSEQRIAKLEDLTNDIQTLLIVVQNDREERRTYNKLHSGS